MANNNSINAPLPISVTNGGTGTSTAFTSGSMVFANGSGVYAQDNSNLFWDNTSKFLGVGINTPTNTLVVSNFTNVVGVLKVCGNYNNGGLFWIGFSPALAGSTSDANDRARIAANINFDGSADLVFLNGTSGVQVERFRVSGINGSTTFQFPISFTNSPLNGIVGVTNGSNVNTGNVGEIVKSNIVFGSAISLVNSTNSDLTSISLTAGDWDLWGNVYINNSASTLSIVNAWISTTSGVTPDNSLLAHYLLTAQGNIGFVVPSTYLQLASTTTVYITGNATFSAGSTTMSGNIYARRRR